MKTIAPRNCLAKRFFKQNYSSITILKLIPLLFLLLLNGCGGGGNNAAEQVAPLQPANSQPDDTPNSDSDSNANPNVNTIIAPVSEASVSQQGNDAALSVSFSLLDDSGEIIAQQSMANLGVFEFALGEISYRSFTLNVEVESATESTSCRLNDVPMGRASDTLFQNRVQPAYLRQSYLFSCTDSASDENNAIRKVLSLVSTKDDLAALFQRSLDLTPDYGATQPNADNVPRQQRNYYYEINNLMSLAAIYTSPEDFTLAPDDPVLQKIESYLIVASEFYFQPCYEYDFYNDEPMSCRSEFKQDGFYLWRSPLNNTPRFRTSHYKIEWRSAAGVAQAVKAILLKHADDNTECLVSDFPTTIREQSVACRAKNLRKMIEEQVWRKWQSEINTTDVMHYVAWLELIVDMFNSTVHIEHDYGCTSNCYQPRTKASLMYRMLDYVTISGDYLNIACRLPGGSSQSCVWRDYDFGLSGSNDLSHLAIPVFVFYETGKAEVCQTVGSKCFRRDAFIRTLKERTWSPVPTDSTAVNFPKFDMFLNGYCGVNVNNRNSGLQDYCQEYWLKETVLNNAHRELYGFVNFGSYDAGLQLMLLQAADVNKDSVIDTNDVLARGYAAFLYRAIQQPQD